MKEEQKKKTDSRQPYEAPKVARVSLRPDEAVLGHCKITGVAGPFSGSCGSVTSCSTAGS
jgi:hypothetical protein